jgi:type IV secretory pathway VirB4 component
MPDLHGYLKAFRKSRSIRDFIPFESFANDRVFYSKSRSVFAVLANAQIDDECMADEELADIAAILTAAHSILDENYWHYRYVFKQRKSAVRLPRCGDAAIDRIAQFREEHLRKQAPIGDIETFEAIERLIPVPRRQWGWMDAEQREMEQRKAITSLEQSLRAYVSCLANVNAPRVLYRTEAFNFLQRLLWLGTPWDQLPDLDREDNLAEQLKRVSVYWDAGMEMLRINRRFVRVFTLGDLPQKTSANLFRELLEIPADMLICSAWQSEDRLSEQERLQALRTLTFNFERRGFGSKKAIREDPTAAEELRNSGVRSDLAELNEAMDALRHKKYIGRYSLTVLLHGEKPDDLDESAAKIEKTFRLPLANINEENGQAFLGGVLPAYLAILPGNRALRLKELRMGNENYAHLSQVYGIDTGSTQSSVLIGEECANLYETRKRALFHEDTHYRLVGAKLIVGMTRSGKSVYHQDGIAAMMAKRPIVRIYDVGASYETLAAYFGGSVLRCSLDEWTLKLNPFYGDIRSRNFREFVFQFVRFLCESDGMHLEPQESLELQKALAGIFALPVDLRRLRTLRAVLTGRLKQSLEQWVEGSQYGHLFDHAKDELASAQFRVYEFEKSDAGMPSPYIEALLTLLVYRDTMEALAPENRGTVKLYTFDECASLWRHPGLVAYMHRILKTLQKKLALVTLLIQTPEDMGSLEPTILQNCSSFAFFPNYKIRPDVLKTKFGFDDAKIAIYRALPPREFLFHALRGNGRDIWKVLKLTIDPMRYWLYTTSAVEVMKRERAIAEHSSVHEAIRILAAEEVA